MYQHTKSPFGKYEKHILSDEAAGNRLELVPGFGACILDIQLDGQSILDGYESPEEMAINRWAKNVFLFPFPNRLKQGVYEWEGQAYQFPINDGQTGNALHGFGMDKPMEVSEVDTGKDEARIKCRYHYEGQFDSYPFPFQLEATISLGAPASVKIEMQVQNTGKGPIPFGMGWHPYFQLSEEAGQVLLQLPPCNMIGVDQVMIPTGKRYEYTTFTQPRRITSEVLDNCFALRQKEGEVQLLLRGDKGELRYWQEVGEGKFGYLQLFTPPHRQSLAVEPMSCNIDAFNNEEGLLKLQAGERAAASFGFSFEAKK